MKLPGIRAYAREWHVNEDVWTLKFTNNLKFYHKELRGLTDPEDYTIYIAKKLSRAETFATFVHEILHAIEFSYENDFPDKKKYTYHDIHNYIHSFEERFADFVLQNYESFSKLFFATKR